MFSRTSPDGSFVPITGTKQGIEEALRQFGPQIERQIARLIGRRGPDVTDLVQTTFTRAVAAYPSFRGEAPVAAWLSRIAVNVVRDHFRTQARRPETISHDDDFQEHGAEQAPADSTFDRRRQLSRLGGYLEKVSPTNRIAFVLHVIDGLSLQEVADLCNVSVLGAKSRVYFARRYLMKRLRKDPLFQEFFLTQEESPS